ncbi:transcriptional regulator [Cohnella kolymensis]|uniref:Transcriptional regulator n=1 Tax=Cohnella kolymensis TaxID=1590652 RepID=A0ABR5A896_9BACL|nr:metalloregulator ArsR/SmtB family transcription factor [Cohnella kolymensis]KIL37254.1 transcriptional regulator [Cohnella kolymensis]
MAEEQYSTRRQLLQLLKTQGSCGIGELSKPLGITEMAVRRHIHTLERDGLIRSTLVRQAMGRPMYSYSLTPEADDLFPKNYPQLTLDLLSELEEQTGGPEVIDLMFQGRRDKLEDRYRPQMQDKPLEDRVSELTSIQNAGGYMTEWERAEDSGTLHLHEYNCPIAQVANRYRQACRCEQQLFETLLDAQVERTECLAEGGGRCTYAIRPKSAAQ